MAETETAVETWYPAEQAELVTTKGWSGPADVINSYTELEKAIGTRVKLPSQDDTVEATAERSAFYNKLGRPETPEGYKLPELPEGKEYDKELIGGIQTAAHEAGVTDAQFTKLVERYLGIEKQRAETTEAERVRAEAESDRVLKEKWGAEYAANTVLVQRACDELITDKEGKPLDELHDAFAALIEEKGLKNNPVFAEVFCGLGEKLLDDNFVPGGGQVQTDTDDDFTPANPKSPDMYANDDSPEGKKNRDWFRKNIRYDYGHDN